VDGLWAGKREGVGLIVVQLVQRVSSYVLLIHQRYRRTDGRTDGQHAIAIPHFAL